MFEREFADRRGFNLALPVLVPLLGAWLLPPAGAAEQTPKSVVFRNVRVFDGTRLLEDREVVIEGGMVTRVGTDLEIPEGAEVIDGTAQTLLPGLIDSHTHVISPNALKQALIFGVTTELDMFTSHRLAKQLKDQQAGGRGDDMADLRSAGTLVTAPGGHGTEYGLEIPTIGKPEEAQDFVDARIAEGSDYIKIIYDVGSPYARKDSTISKQTLAAVVKAAHARQKLAIVHCSTLQGAKDAIKAGADALAHLFADEASDPRFAALVAEHNAFVIPTLSVLESACGVPSGECLITDPHLGPYLTFNDRNSLKRSFPARADATRRLAAMQRAIRQLKAAGVPILAGTDAPNPGTTHGASIHRELELLVRAGLTPTEALASATAVPAKHFSLPDRGRIARGLRADLLLVKGDPTQDILTTRNIVGVWKQGVRVDREAYRGRLDEQKTLAERQGQAPPPPGAASGLVSDFEGDKPAAQFGFGWAVSTDSFMGGKSTAEINVVSGGAHGSKGSLEITGEVAEGIAYPWAGAIFYPGKIPMTPANLSSKKSIRFWAKGDGQTYNIMLFAQSFGFVPASQSFVPAPEWQEYSFELSAFRGTDGRDLTGVFFGAGPAPGTFAFQIDDVRFEE